MENKKADVQGIIGYIIAENMPQIAVKKALENHTFSKNIYLVAIGKAAFTMAKAASDFLGDRIKEGLVITKYDHAEGPIPGLEVIEAGHPTPDENTIMATQKAITLAEKLGAEDELLFLVSGGGSALFEAPRDGISFSDLVGLNDQLLASGADIIEVNLVRKRLSKVKAGRFAQIAAPAKVFSVVLSDVLGDRLDSIASGPTAPDLSTVSQVEKMVAHYNIKLSDLQAQYLKDETPKETPNVTTVVTGSVKTLCQAAATATEKLGFTPIILTNNLNCEAREAGRFLASIALDIQAGSGSITKPAAIILGGETVVSLKGNGLGGRNQELALSAAKEIAGLENTLLFSLGSDGTDGPTDAAGGLVDGNTVSILEEKGLDIDKFLENNDAYHALQAADALIMTGPTGTNVNDVAVLLCW